MYDAVMHDASNDVKPHLGELGSARRVAVIGRAGAGKTRVARQIGDTLDLPVVHLDRLHWAPGWRPVERSVFEARQAEAVAGDAWVIDGGYLGSEGWPDRLRRAEVVVLVEAPLRVCIARIIRRSVMRGGGRRADLPDGCEERFSLAFIGWTLAWGWRTRGVMRAVRRSGRGIRVG